MDILISSNLDGFVSSKRVSSHIEELDGNIPRQLLPTIDSDVRKNCLGTPSAMASDAPTCQ
jgi:hypothetical protein